MEIELPENDPVAPSLSTESAAVTVEDPPEALSDASTEGQADDAEGGPSVGPSEGVVGDSFEGSHGSTRRRFDDPGLWVGLITVALCCLFVFWVVQPQLVFRNSTPTGGDMGAHVWGPAYIRDHLLPQMRLTGWTNDWYAGFPAYTFYMVLPSLAIILLDVGIIPFLSIWGFLVSMVLIAGAVTGWLRAGKIESSWKRFLVRTAMVVAPLAIIEFPYNVAFKLIAISGLVTFPAAIWYFLRGMGLRQPGPELGALASVLFLMDRTLFHIYGGNIASTMAGEFAFSISLTLGIFALGAIARGVRTGGHGPSAALLIAGSLLCHVIPGLFFVAIGAVLIVVMELAPRAIRFLTGGEGDARGLFIPPLAWAAGVGVAGGLSALWWYLPFYGRSAFLNDMGWEKLGRELCSDGMRTNWGQLWRNLLPFADHMVTSCDNPTATSYSDPNMWMGKPIFVLAAIGAILSIIMVVRSGIWLTVVTLLAAVAFVVMPQDRFWNARVLPFYYLAIYLLAAVGLALVFRALMFVLSGRPSDPPVWASAGMVAMAMLVIFFGLAMTLRAVPFGSLDATGAVYRWGPFESTYFGPVRGWARWNFEGLESKPGEQETTDAQGKKTTTINTTDSTEYFAMIDMMRSVGKTEGCGRAFWEYDEDLNKYGTPMAPMLLPYFTDSCIGSMEGLYFEASSTTPFHFLVQSELSERPSRPERFDEHLGFDSSPYQAFSLDQGVKHLQMLGVKYFMAFRDSTKSAIAQAAKLKKLASAGPWEVYEVPDIQQAVALENLPNVWTNVADDIHEWARPAVDWFNTESEWDVLRASSGPKGWPRISSKADAKTVKAPHPDLVVSNYSTTDHSIEFDVSEIGSPVLVRTSYFPNWEAEGADGPYRVTPNLMVVVPTAKHVELTYGRSALEWISWILSLIGFAMIAALVVRRPSVDPTSPTVYLGDGVGGGIFGNPAPAVVATDSVPESIEVPDDVLSQVAGEPISDAGSGAVVTDGVAPVAPADPPELP